MEKRLFKQECNEQEVIDIIWKYESYWSLLWALGLLEDEEIKIPDNVCHCKKAIDIVLNCNSYDEFKNKTKIRDIEEILDMLDIYYRYHWACVNLSFNPNTNIGSLNPEVVWERRRGLELLISTEYDWNDISLDT